MVQMRGSFLENAKECLRTVSMLFSLFAHNFLYPLHTIFKTLATYSMPTSSCNIKKSDISVCGKVQRDVFVNRKKKKPKCFQGYSGISLSVFLSVCSSMYKILVILCWELFLQFCCIVDPLIMIILRLCKSFQPFTPYDSSIISPWMIFGGLNCSFFFFSVCFLNKWNLSWEG